MDPLLSGALLSGLQTGLSPAQQVDISQYYGPQETKKDNTFLYVSLIVAAIVAAGTIYFITKK